MQSKVDTSMAASRPERRKLIGTPKEKILFRMISEEQLL
jgi:hypothetical protein